MANKFPFLPRKFEIEAALKRKCDCNIHVTDTKRFHSRTESLKEIYRSKDAITIKVGETSSVENMVANKNVPYPWTPTREKVAANSSLNYPCSSTPYKEMPLEMPITGMPLGYNFDSSNSKDYQWRNEINGGYNFHPMTNQIANTNHSTKKNFENKHTLNPHFESQRVNIPVNSDFPNTNVDSTNFKDCQWRNEINGVYNHSTNNDFENKRALNPHFEGQRGTISMNSDFPNTNVEITNSKDSQWRNEINGVYNHSTNNDFENKHALNSYFEGQRGTITMNSDFPNTSVESANSKDSQWRNEINGLYNHSTNNDLENKHAPDPHFEGQRGTISMNSDFQNTSVDSTNSKDSQWRNEINGLYNHSTNNDLENKHAPDPHFEGQRGTISMNSDFPNTSVDSTNSKYSQWRNEINGEYSFHPMRNQVDYTAHFTNSNSENKHDLNPHYKSRRVDISKNSDIVNEGVDNSVLSCTSSFGNSFNSFKSEESNSSFCVEAVSMNEFCYPVVKKFKDKEEHTKWLNETKFETGFIDTHCHLDFLFKKTDHFQSLDSFINFCEETEPFPKSFLGCVAVFCDPRSFFKFNWWQIILSNDKVWGAFGCHPHFTRDFGPDEENMLRYALMNEKVIATGEIGLDYSRKNGTDHEQQRTVFEKQLIIALEVKKPIVIHCRDAFNDAFTIMKKILPKNYTIHLHCFTGSLAEATAWMEHFPNLYFGFTSIITQENRRATNVKKVAQALPLNRILLETDAPYFRPFYMKKGNYSHPGMAIHVASAISTLRQIPIQIVLEEARKNTFNVYNI